MQHGHAGRNGTALDEPGYAMCQVVAPADTHVPIAGTVAGADPEPATFGAHDLLPEAGTQPNHPNPIHKVGVYQPYGKPATPPTTGLVAYSYSDHVRRAFPKIATAGFTNEELTERIARADAVIDSYVARRYAVPLAATPATAPPLAKQLSVDFAMLDVFDRSANTPEWIRRRFEQDDYILKALASGEMALVGVDGSLVDERVDVGTVRSNTEEFVPVFGAVPSLDEEFDPNREEAEKNARGE